MVERDTALSYKDVVSALSRPEMYPGRPDQVEHIETHASDVFIAREDVYKLKKPVDLGFLDYSTLDQRRLMCNLEVQLNRRLAPNVYLGVEELVRAGGNLQLGGNGEVVDYLVHMKYLPEEATLTARIAENAVDYNDMDAVAECIARFHEQAERGPEIDRWGLPPAIEQNTEENFEQVEPYIDRAVPRSTFERIVEYSRGFLVEQRGLLHQRVLDGLIRDGHGDIRAEHVYFLDEVTIIDCIEFNERIRYGDVASDVAFLAMELDVTNRPDLCDRLIETYERTSGFDIKPVLDFYRCYRAVVRAKVAAFQLDPNDREQDAGNPMLRRARRHFHLAWRYATGDRKPRLILMNGLTGSGKSTLARELAQALPAELVDSDTTRKQLSGLSPTDRARSGYGKGIYSSEMTARVYGELLRRARELLKRGQTVILDATYTRASDRKNAYALARELGASYTIAVCQVSEAIARTRLRQRQDDPTSVSDGRWEIYLSQRETADPLTGAEDLLACPVDASRPLESQVETVLLYLERDGGD